MPYDTTWEEDGIHWHFYGIVSPEEVAEADREMYSHPGFGSLKYYIWDLMDVEQVAISLLDVELSAASDWAVAPENCDIKGALAAKDEHAQKCIKHYIATAMELECCWDLIFFESIEEAREWVSS